MENEISRRYVDNPPEFYFPQWRGKPEGSAKQGSEDFVALPTDVLKSYHSAIEVCKYAYNELLRVGVAPEQARFVLPQAMYTEWYWTGSLAAYARFYSQRSESHAQWEIRKYAEAIGELINPLFPSCWSVLTNYK